MEKTHYLPHGDRWVSESFACGRSAVGRRDTRIQFNPENTECPGCLEALKEIKTN